MNQQTPPVSLVLEESGIPHTTFIHPGPVKSLEQAARERGQRPEQIVRSILFRIAEDEYVMALVAGPAQISWKALRDYLGKSGRSIEGHRISRRRGIAFWNSQQAQNPG
jgi:prolyl-tRNA editing enzyme YbaK/EbsC (Cys-tRNA(Pro) deacylase)